MGLQKKGYLIESIYEFPSPNLTSQNCYKKKALSKNLWLHCDVQANLDQEVTPKPHRRAVRELPTVSGKHGKINWEEFCKFLLSAKQKPVENFIHAEFFLVFARYRPDRILPWREQKTISPDLHIGKNKDGDFKKRC